MSFIPSIFGGNDDDETDGSGDTPLDTGAVLEANGIPRDPADFAAIFDEEVQEGTEETLVISDDGETYAGEWPREMIENAYANPTQPTWIGYEEARNPLEGVNEVGILHEELNSHMAIFGASGFGKSTLLLNMMTQWAYAGYGFCFIDPKGDDSHNLIQMLPEHRLDDVYWMEPGSHVHQKVIGMNFLHTHSSPGDREFDSEVSRVIGDLIPILKATATGWGATMDSIVQNIARRMLEDEHKDYNLLDIYTLINDPEHREELPDYYDDPLQRQMAEQIANYKQDDVVPLMRRLQKFAENRSAREVVAHTESDLDAHEIINDNKIVILRTSNVDEDLQRLIATTVMRRLWSVIATRSKAEDNAPYFLVADEFGKVAGAGNNVEDMLSRGRSLGLSLTLASQQPSQLDELQDSLGNVKNFISFSPGDKDDARFISTRIGMDADMLMRLPQYNAYCNLSIGDEQKTGPVRTHTFAPYPPLRSKDEARAVIDDIVETHGQQRLGDETPELTSHPLKSEPTTSTKGGDTTRDDLFEVNDDGDTLTKQELLECIFDAQLQTGDGDPDTFTTTTEVEKQIARRLGKNINENYGAKTSSALEQLPDRYLDKDLDDDVYLKLAPSGRDLVFNVESGESGSAGKMVHRVLLEKSYLMFRHLGYEVDIPRQEGRMPDGVCKPQSDLNPNTASNYKEAQRRERKLKENYPRLYELFGTDELHIEPENSTLTKPKQPFKNLIKAMEADRKCVFVVKDGTVDGKDFAHNARKIHTWITKNKFARDVKNGNRVFYNFNQKFQLGDGMFAAKPHDGEYSRWREDGDRIILEHPEGDEPYVEFKSIDHLAKPKPSDFPFYYKRNNRTQKTELYAGGGKRLDTYQNRKSIEDDGVIPIRRPFVPELELPTWPLPEDWDGYEIVIIPGDRTDMSPHIYDVRDEHDREVIPIFEDDTDIEAVNNIETDGDTTVLSNPDGADDESDEDESNGPDEADGETATDADENADPFDDIDQAIVDETTTNPNTPKLTDKRGDTGESTESPAADDDDEDDDTPSVDNSMFEVGEDTGDAKNADEVPVADGKKPKSTNDVVKESDDQWTKPEPGDDDYDASKDNSNFRTGYRTENSGDWTGGAARDEDSPDAMDEHMEKLEQEKEERKQRAIREAMAKKTGTPPDDDKDDPDANEPSDGRDQTPDTDDDSEPEPGRDEADDEDDEDDEDDAASDPWEDFDV